MLFWVMGPSTLPEKRLLKHATPPEENNIFVKPIPSRGIATNIIYQKLVFKGERCLYILQMSDDLANPGTFGLCL